ncbi:MULTISPECIES: hypothetical protein [Paenibacillus]|uniref:Uncharacterized protein n=1 Tax=Paenibacillus alvei TaxID=44250 RepID=A0ABT4EJR5_PAEAL|nr:MULTISPECIES: hypothetical protein [Paenibacillus]MCY9533345.1 hypothetical protein [Paenibacillus alvei]
MSRSRENKGKSVWADDMNDVKESEYFDSELESILQQYRVELPEVQRIDSTIDVLRKYVPDIREDARESSMMNVGRRWINLWKIAAADIGMFSKLYWMSCLVLFGVGVWIGVTVQQMPAIVVILFSPLPFVIGLLEVFKGREQGVLEMELACKVSAQELMLSRLLFILLNSLVLNTCLSGLLYLDRGDISFWGLTWTWFTPFIIVASSSLWLAMRIRCTVSSMVTISIWMAVGMILLTRPDMLTHMMDLHIFILILVNAGAVYLLIRQGWKLLRNHTFIAEGSLSYGANDSEYF